MVAPRPAASCCEHRFAVRARLARRAHEAVPHRVPYGARRRRFNHNHRAPVAVERVQCRVKPLGVASRYCGQTQRALNAGELQSALEQQRPHARARRRSNTHDRGLYFFALSHARQPHLSVRSVVPRGAARRALRLRVIASMINCHRPGPYRFAKQVRERVRADAARPQDNWRVARQIEHGAFDPNLAGSPVKNQRDTLAETIRNMLGRGGRELGESIRTRRRDRYAGLAQQCQCGRMCGHPNRDRIRTGGHDIRYDITLAQHERKRAGPARSRQTLGALGPVCDQCLCRVTVGHVYDDGIPRRPALGGEDPGDGRRIERVRAKAVNGLGGKRDEFAALQQRRSPDDRFGGDGDDGNGYCFPSIARFASRSTSDGAISLSRRPSLPRHVMTRSRSRLAAACRMRRQHSSVGIVSPGRRL